jgi:small GTP-binding protein
VKISDVHRKVIADRANGHARQSSVQNHHDWRFRVGKTAIVSRMSQNTFLSNHVPTVGSQFVTLEWTMEDHLLIFEVWDTAGQEVYRSLVGFYARGAMGAFLVFDVTSQATFNSLATWVKFVRLETPNVKIVIVGNKTDLGRRCVTSERLQELATENGCDFIEGSAKTGQNITEAFSKMAEMLVASTDETAFNQQGGSAAEREGGSCC